MTVYVLYILLSVFQQIKIWRAKNQGFWSDYLRILQLDMGSPDLRYCIMITWYHITILVGSFTNRDIVCLKVFVCDMSMTASLKLSLVTGRCVRKNRCRVPVHTTSWPFRLALDKIFVLLLTKFSSCSWQTFRLGLDKLNLWSPLIADKPNHNNSIFLWPWCWRRTIGRAGGSHIYQAPSTTSWWPGR